MLCFKLVTPGAGPVLTPGASFEQFGRGPLGDATYQISPFSFRKKELLSFPSLFLCFELVTPKSRPVLTQGHHINNLGTSPLGDASYQISNLCTFLFQRRRILKFSFFVPMFRTCDSPGAGPVLTPGVSYEQSWYRSTRRYYIQNIKALHFLVSEKRDFKVFLLCSYVLNLWPPGQGQFWPQGHHMNNLDRGPLGDATYQISKLYAF